MRAIQLRSAAFVAALLSMFASPVFAAAIDVAAVVDDIEAQLGPVGLIGAAILLLIVGIKAYKWVRRAM